MGWIRRKRRRALWLPPLPPLGVATVCMVVVISVFDAARLAPSWLCALALAGIGAGLGARSVERWWASEIARRMAAHAHAESYLHRVLLRACRLMGVPASYVGSAEASESVRVGWPGSEVIVRAVAAKQMDAPLDVPEAGIFWLPAGGDITIEPGCEKHSKRTVVRGGVWNVPLRLWWYRVSQDASRICSR